MTAQTRMNKALEAALNATPRDAENRYQSAMIARAEAILKRSTAQPDPDTLLPLNAKTTADDIRSRSGKPANPEQLRKYVIAKLEVSKPAFLAAKADK